MQIKQTAPAGDWLRPLVPCSHAAGLGCRNYKTQDRIPLFLVFYFIKGNGPQRGGATETVQIGELAAVSRRS
jgi:hypothetical protein